MSEVWEWVETANRYGARKKEGACSDGGMPVGGVMIQQSTYDRRYTSTTFWPEGQRFVADHHLKGETWRSIEEAQHAIAQQSFAYWLGRSVRRNNSTRSAPEPKTTRNPVEHWCDHPDCTEWGSFGFGPPMWKTQRWYCAAHSPEQFSLPRVSA